MEYLTLLIMAVSLAMDAFAVSICDGMCYTGLSKGKTIFIPATFGVFQGVMPIIGYFVGSLFYAQIEAFDHWIAFGILSVIGAKMVFDGARELASKEETEPKDFSIGGVLIQGVATSIDALAVGISFLAMSVSIWIGGAVIAAVTFVIALIGILLGRKFGQLLKNKAPIAEIVGGIVLIGIGVKILLEHLLA